MDGLDLQPTGRFDGTREQGTCPCGFLAVRRTANQVLEPPGEYGIVALRPAGKLLEHLGGHLRGGRLGEGQAQHRAGVRARQQQPQHAAGQHIGLSGTGIGGHPDRGLRIGGGALARPGGRIDDEIVVRAAHDPASASLAALHSRNRDR